MIECAFCDNEGTVWDPDLEMALCGQHYAEMNNVSDIELNEVF